MIHDKRVALKKKKLMRNVDIFFDIAVTYQN